MTRSNYAGDPRWIVARFSGSCRSCSAPVGKGSRALYWPRVRGVQCERCGATAWARFLSEVADEDAYNGVRGGVW